MKRAFYRIFSASLIVLLSAQTTLAGYNAGYVYSYEDRDSIFDRGDVQVAVDQFCRMLALDTREKTIEQKLKTIVSYPNLTATQKTDVLQMEDLLNYIDNLERRVTYLIDKRNHLRNKMIEKGYSRTGILQGLDDIKRNISGSRESFSYQKQSLFDRESPIVVINDILTDEKLQLAVRVRSLEDQFNWLKAVYKGEEYLPMRQHCQECEESFSVADDNGYDMPDYSEIASTQTQERTQGYGGNRLEISTESLNRNFSENIEGELDPIYDRLNTLQGRIEKEGGKIGDLQDQVVDLSLKLSETEMILREKADAVLSLTDQLTDVEQRWALGQRIIEEKNDQMHSLERDLQKARLESEGKIDRLNDAIDGKDRKLDDLQKALSDELKRGEELERIIALNEQKLSKALDSLLSKRDQINPEDVSDDMYDRETAELNRMLGSLKSELAESDKEVRQKIMNLKTMKQTLNDVQTKVRSDREIFREKNQEIAFLRARMDNLERSGYSASEEVNALLEKKDRELKKLNGFLNIYRKGLGDARKVIENKNAQVASLEEKLESLERQFGADDGKYQEKNAQIRLLKEALLSEKDKREARNVNLRQVIRQKDEQIDELKEGLDRAQRSLEVANRTIQEKVAHLSYVQNELEKMKREIRFGKMSPGADFSDRKLEELAGMLAIYKDKLLDEKRAASKKANDIVALERQLALMESALHERDEELTKTQENLSDLRSQLLMMKEEFKKFLNHPQETRLKGEDLNGQMERLQAEFQEINNFLVENLNDSDTIKSHRTVR